MLRNIISKLGFRTNSRIGAAAAKAAPAMPFETLEGRQLMSVTMQVVAVAGSSAPAIVVNGDNLSNNIQLYPVGTTGVGVWADGKVVGQVKGPVSSVTVNALGGHDRVVVNSKLTVRTTLNGGDGNDILRGGGGADTLNGGNGNDVLIAVGGGKSDTLTGAAGKDGFWLDNSPTTERVADADGYENSIKSVHRVTAFQAYNTINDFGQRVRVTPTNELNGQTLTSPDLGGAGEDWYDASGQDLFSSAGPSRDDVNQGVVGDCYFLSTLSAVAGKNADVIRQSVVDLMDGTYAVRFFRNGQEVYVRVNGALPEAGGINAYLSGAGFGRDDSIWVGIMEKAFTIFRAGYSIASYNNIEGGNLVEPMQALGVKSIVDKDYGVCPFTSGSAMYTWAQQQLSAGRIVTLGTRQMPDNNGTPMIGGHVYTVVGATTTSTGTQVLILRNPWGADGPIQIGSDDGYIAVTMNEAMFACDGIASAVV